MEKLMLNDLLHLSKDELSKTRIKLNVWNGYDSPIRIYKENPSAILTWNYWKRVLKSREFGYNEN